MTMLSLIKSAATRSDTTLVQDAAGAGAIAVMLLVCLNLPVVF